LVYLIENKKFECVDVILIDDYFDDDDDDY
jgi:hypothetical protein